MGDLPVPAWHCMPIHKAHVLSDLTAMLTVRTLILPALACRALLFGRGEEANDANARACSTAGEVQYLRCYASRDDAPASSYTCFHEHSLNHLCRRAVLRFCKPPCVACVAKDFFLYSLSCGTSAYPRRAASYLPYKLCASIMKPFACCLQARAVSSNNKAWDAIHIPKNLGVECGNYKWLQNQHYVFFYFLLPGRTPRKQVCRRSVEPIAHPGVIHSTTEVLVHVLAGNSHTIFCRCIIDLRPLFGWLEVQQAPS